MKRLLVIAAMAAVCFAASAQNVKFAYVNYEELVQLHPSMDDAREVLQNTAQTYQDELMAMNKEYQDKIAAYQDAMKKNPDMPASIRERKEKEIMDIEQRMQDTQAEGQQYIQQKQQQLYAPIYADAQEAVTKIAKEGGYTLVFEQNGILYIDPAQCDNLTPKARKALNIPDDRTLESLQAELQAKAAAAQAQAQ